MVQTNRFTWGLTRWEPTGPSCRCSKNWSLSLLYRFVLCHYMWCNDVFRRLCLSCFINWWFPRGMLYIGAFAVLCFRHYLNNWNRKGITSCPIEDLSESARLPLLCNYVDPFGPLTCDSWMYKRFECVTKASRNG